MTKHIHFNLVSPEKSLISGLAAHVVIPAAEGEMGVGADHTSIVTALKPGVLKLFVEKMGHDGQHIFITGGFADVTGAQCTVLAEEAVAVEDLDSEVLRQQLNNLNEDLDLAEKESDKDRIRAKIVVVQAKITAATGQLLF